MLQTVAIVGPVRFSAPLTQAMSAPLLGAMHARGRRPAELFAVCLAIRLVNYAVITAFAMFVLLGPKGYAGSYEALLGWLSLLRNGLAGGPDPDGHHRLRARSVLLGGPGPALPACAQRWSARIIVDAPQPAAVPPAQRGGTQVDRLWDDAERAGWFGEEPDSSGAITQSPNQPRSFSIASGTWGSRRRSGWGMAVSSASRPVILSVLFPLHPLVLDPNRCG